MMRVVAQPMRRRVARLCQAATLGVLGGAATMMPMAAVHRGEDPPVHVFGTAHRPRISITVEPSEASSGRCFVAVMVLTPDGVEPQAATTDQSQPATCRPAGHSLEVVGTSRIDGREIQYRATASSDWRTLEWAHPAAVTLHDGSVHQLAGRYERLSEAARLASARAAFAVVDRELNAVYRRLVATRDPGSLAALRADQRRWLVFRDFTLFDGDNADAVGPGTSAHVREQARRTRARIRFLSTLLNPPVSDPRETWFSDGRSGTVAVRRVGDALSFSAGVQFPGLNASDAPASVPCIVTGVARPSGSQTWVADAGSIVVSDDTWKPEPLLFTIDQQHRLRVDAANRSPGMLARVIGGTYAPQRRLLPAEAPIRSLIWDLPERAFDDTTDGLTDAARHSLVLSGTGGTFAVLAETTDRLVLRHHDGRVTIARFAGADGSAVLAVEQTNGRSLSVQVWRQASVGGPFAEWREALPIPPVVAFFAADPGGNTTGSRSRGKVVASHDETGTLRLRLSVEDGAPEPDHEFALVWDGFGFVAVQL